MKKFKEAWEIQHNWQLFFPLLGVLGLGYSAFKLSNAFFHKFGLSLVIVLAVILFFSLLYITLRLFKWLEKRWILNYRWEMIRVFIVFAVTGSSSMYIGRPIMKWMGISQENLGSVLYWFLFIVIGLIFYQILLVTYGWLFGQFKFFWEFEKKMLKRFGLFKEKI
jgi:hypothetical protein